MKKTCPCFLPHYCCRSSRRTGSAVLTITSSASTSGNALVFDRTIAKWRPVEASFIWTEGCYMKKSGTAIANTVSYSLSNLPASEKFAIALNGEPVTQGGGDLYASDAAGTLTFPVTLGSLADEITVRLNSSRATIIQIR